MKPNISTNKDQSARLLRCGVSADTADMARYEDDSVPMMPWDWTTGSYGGTFPAWSLSVLLTRLLPKHLDDFPFTKWIAPFGEDEICYKENEDILNGDVKLYYNGTNWIVDYDFDGFTGTLPQSVNPIEACVQAIELLYANGYKFNEI